MIKPDVDIELQSDLDFGPLFVTPDQPLNFRYMVLYNDAPPTAVQKLSHRRSTWKDCHGRTKRQYRRYRHRNKPLVAFFDFEGR